jgi:O-acetyl-ADP-ribose deacetylase (regulator of RNase III)
MGETMTEKHINGKVVRLIKGDVTAQEVDAFVFYATSNLVLGSGFGTAISVRGGQSIQKELSKLAPVEVGNAVVTGGGDMKAKYIIHAVGPKFQEPDEEGKLRKTMHTALEKAEEKGVETLAFPAMGTGFYGIQPDLCARVMLDTIKDHLNGATSLKKVWICLMDTREIVPFTRQLEALNI